MWSSDTTTDDDDADDRCGDQVEDTDPGFDDGSCHVRRLTQVTIEPDNMPQMGIPAIPWSKRNVIHMGVKAGSADSQGDTLHTGGSTMSSISSGRSSTPRGSSISTLSCGSQESPMAFPVSWPIASLAEDQPQDSSTSVQQIRIQSASGSDQGKDNEISQFTCLDNMMHVEGNLVQNPVTSDIQLSNAVPELKHNSMVQSSGLSRCHPDIDLLKDANHFACDRNHSGLVERSGSMHQIHHSADPSLDPGHITETDDEWPGTSFLQDHSPRSQYWASRSNISMQVNSKRHSMIVMGTQVTPEQVFRDDYELIKPTSTIIPSDYFLAKDPVATSTTTVVTRSPAVTTSSVYYMSSVTTTTNACAISVPSEVGMKRSATTVSGNTFDTVQSQSTIYNHNHIHLNQNATYARSCGCFYDRHQFVHMLGLCRFGIFRKKCKARHKDSFSALRTPRLQPRSLRSLKIAKHPLDPSRKKASGHRRGSNQSNGSSQQLGSVQKKRTKEHVAIETKANQRKLVMETSTVKLRNKPSTSNATSSPSSKSMSFWRAKDNPNRNSKSNFDAVTLQLLEAEQDADTRTQSCDTGATASSSSKMSSPVLPKDVFMSLRSERQRRQLAPHMEGDGEQDVNAVSHNNNKPFGFWTLKFKSPTRRSIRGPPEKERLVAGSNKPGRSDL